MKSPSRSLPFHAPVRAWSLAEWALVPLRLFLGVTFTFAGLQKLANPNFLNAASPISIQAELLGASRTSPIHALLRHLEGGAKPIGLLIAFGEVAIGLGTLLGLWTRVAAVAGLIISLSLFLTVSYHSSPYFTGSDIVFFFAWIPFIIAGGGTRLSLDAFIAKRSAQQAGAPSPELVAIPFATVQTICGHFNDGHCNARAGLDCDAAFCPVLLGDRAPLTTRVAVDGIDRRAVMLGGAAVATVGVGALLLAGATAEAGRAIGGASSPTPSGTFAPPPTTTTSPSTGGPTTTSPPGKLLGPASDVPRNHAATFVVPSNGDPGIVVHTDAGDFVAYDAVCPHMGCTVGYSRTSKIIICPCHGSQFNLTTGDVIVGPAPHGLEKFTVVEGSNGDLYLE